MQACFRTAASSLVVGNNVPIPQVKPGFALVRNEYAGVNFIDLYYRSGLYPTKEGQVMGAEAGGRVVGCENSDWLNKRVVFFDLGAFAEYSLVPISRLVPVPDQVAMPTALALTTMGLTAHYLCTSVGKIQRGDKVLVHAAGSGTGKLVAQIASRVFDCQVVGTCSPAKRGLVPLPATHIVTSYQEVDKIVAPLSGDSKFDLVLDGVGKDSYQASLQACKPRGLVCFFGNASGPVPPLDLLGDVCAHGSLFVTRPKLGDYVSTHEELLWRARDVFAWLERGHIVLDAAKEFHSLAQAQEALDYVQSRKATSKVVIKI